MFVDAQRYAFQVCLKVFRIVSHYTVWLTYVVVPRDFAACCFPIIIFHQKLLTAY